MSLSLADRAFNEEKLQVLLGTLVNLGVDQKQIELLLPTVSTVLDDHHIVLGLPQGLLNLQELLNQHARLAQLNQEKFQVELYKWVVDYKQLDKKDTKKNKKRHRLSIGLTQSLLTLGVVGDRVWGNDYDLRTIFKGIMTKPENVKTAGTHILTSVGLANVEHVDANEQKAGYKDLQDSIDTVLKQLPKEEAEVNLLIPVSCQSHWRLVGVKINKDRHLSATLWDPFENEGLATSPAVENMKKAVIGLAPQVHVTAVAAKVPNNGFTCMDYVAQKIIKVALPNTQDVGLQLISSAPDADSLRKATIAKIKQNLPNVNVASNGIKDLFRQAIPRDELENTLFLTFNEYASGEVEKVKEGREVQEQFDAIMSSKLNTLYTKSASSEEELVSKARVYAFRQMQKRFGFFSPDHASTPSQLEANSNKQPTIEMPAIEMPKIEI